MHKYTVAFRRALCYNTDGIIICARIRVRKKGKQTHMNRKRMLSALLALLLLLPALSAAATAVEAEVYVNVAVGSPYTASKPYT